jgi:hypothetical protein
MQATLQVKCGQCERKIGEVKMDTADMPNDLQKKINKVILGHRSDCKF